MPEPAVSFSIVAKNAAGKVLGEVNQDLVRTRAAAAGARQSFTEMNGAASSGANIFAGFGQRLNTMTEAGHGANMGFRMIKSSMAGMALESLGAHNQVGRLLEGMLLFGVGSGPMIAIAAGLIGVVALYQHLSGAADDARDRLDKLTQANLKFVESKGHGLGAIGAALYEPSDEDRKKQGAEAKSLMEQKADAERAVEEAKRHRDEIPVFARALPISQGIYADRQRDVEAAEGRLRQITLRENQLLDDRTEKLRTQTEEIEKQVQALMGEGVAGVTSKREALQKALIDKNRLPGGGLMEGALDDFARARGEALAKTFIPGVDTNKTGPAPEGYKLGPGGTRMPIDTSGIKEDLARFAKPKPEKDDADRKALLATHAATSGVLAMANAALSGEGALRSMTAGLASALPGLVKGPWGIVLGGAAALIGGLFGNKSQPAPVRVDSVSSQAARAIADASTNDQPQNVTVQVMSPSSGEILEQLQVDLANASKRDRIIRLPRSGVL